MSSRLDEYRATYKKMADEQLLELAGQADDLMAEARTALWAELGRRGITEEAIKVQESETPPSSPPSPADLVKWDLMGDRTPTLPPSDFVAVFSAGSTSEADQAQELLRASGIESQLQIVILVAHAEADKALRIFSEQLDPDPNAEEEDGEA
jgi:hypothetical protein